MKGLAVKKLFCLLLSAGLLLGLLAGCGSPSGGSSAPKSAASKAETSEGSEGERETVSFWYLWGGAEEQVILSAIEAYNASQDRYTVVGTMTDIQAQTAGMASSSGPDVTDIIDVNVASLAKNGAIMSLEDNMAQEGYDTSDFNAAALELCSYDGQLYGLPLNAMTNMIFYNKAAFEEAGITETPTTMEELYEAVTALTITDESGAITQWGWPWKKEPTPVDMFILARYFGATWVSDDGKTATCDEAAMLEAYDYFMQYVDTYGRNNVEAYVGKYAGTDSTSQDPLFTGAMAMRMDGMYLYTSMVNAGYDPEDFGVFEMPVPEGKPELEGTQHIVSSIFIIPEKANKKDGAWDFLKWVCSEEGMTLIDGGFQNEPARMSLLDSEELAGENPFYKDFVACGQKKPVTRFPSVAISDEYMAAITSATDDIFNGNSTAQEAMSKVAEEMTAKLQS